MTNSELMTRIEKMLPLLGSDKSGEVAATAAAITRALKGAGLDWHDMVKWLSAGQSGRRTSEPPPRQEQYRRREYAHTKPSYHRPEEPDGWKSSFTAEKWQALARRILSMDTTYLKSLDLEFLNNASEWNSAPTFKQERWMKDIMRKMHIYA